MDWLHELVGIGGEDGKCLQRRAFLGAPALPQAGEGERLAGRERKGEWLFCLGIEALPLVEGVSGHQTAPLLERIPVGRLRRNIFGAGVDGVVADLCVFCPKGHQAPAQQGNLAFAGVAIQAHHRLDALRRRVVAGRKTGHLFEFKAEPIG